jgi:hypothetical protein
MAMLILAVGLLGLEAAGIGAARSIALADRQSGYAAIAADSLESAMHQLRRQTLPLQFCQSDLPFGDKLSRTVVFASAQLATVTVQAIPNPDSQNKPTETFQMSSSLYLPVLIPGSILGSACS